MMNIIFVCTGNTCRSPMAEGIFKKLLKDNNMNSVSVSSAGLSAFDGEGANSKAIACAERFGADIKNHVSHNLTREEAENADIIFCMTSSHAAALKTVIDPKKVEVLGAGIPDPYGQSEEVYMHCAEKISASLLDVIKRLKKD